MSRPTKVDALKIGMVLRGKVKSLVEFGAFVDIGVGRDGLAHISALKRAGLDGALHVGDEIEVQIRRIELDNGRISLTIPGVAKGTKTQLAELTAGTVMTGRVVRLVDFGAFVDLGAQTDGLLHVSQFPTRYVNHPSEIVKVGDEVQVRILEVDVDKRRISLTMKTDEPAAAPRERQERTDRSERSERSDRSDRSERPARSERPDRRRSGPPADQARSRRSQPVMYSSSEDPESHGPTAFELAYREALSNQRRSPR
ncbi:MAG: S1 RNA-binding domain-containing protein [Chloroflexota bacterium]